MNQETLNNFKKFFLELPIADRLAIEGEIFLENCQAIAEMEQESSSKKNFHQEVSAAGLDIKDADKRVKIFRATENAQVTAIAPLGALLLMQITTQPALSEALDRVVQEESRVDQQIAAEIIKEVRRERKQKKKTAPPPSPIVYKAGGRIARAEIKDEVAIASLEKQMELGDVSLSTILAEAVVYREEIQQGLWRRYDMDLEAHNNRLVLIN